ncbi:MAG: MoxR family ATPase, partial [Planctomycetales bacterium]|nr:MoxR family ATPase [Planctomycetales bacterium]
DEINRASPRTQSALLEAMAERQVSLDGRRYRLPRPFLVIATQNPTGSHGTFPLPESQLDRFMLQMSLEYPDREHEVDLLYDTTDGTISAGHQELAPVLSISEVKAIQAEVDAVHVDRRVAEYLVEIVRATRCDTRVRTGSSTRGTRMLFRAAQSAALLANRQFVMPDDVQRVAPLVLAHRIVLRVTTHGSGQATREVIQRIISELAVPI